MSDRTLVSLTPSLIELDSSEFEELCAWPFADPYVGRMLRDDIPQRVQYGGGRIWIYRDPSSLAVGFGTFDICSDYRAYTNNAPHTYIPLLAVNPRIKSLGYGESIVRHLIGEAAIAVRQATTCYDFLFLDVYADNARAIRLYERCAFSRLIGGPLHDMEEDGREYIIMARRVSTPAESAPPRGESETDPKSDRAG
jgi:ribosomal protein S18 acetylase RimI-like enzyme